MGGVLSVISVLSIAVTSLNAEHRVVYGNAGVGKSYILRALGCSTLSCSGTQSCTQAAMVCPGGFVDTIGLNHDGLGSDGMPMDYEIIYEGKSVKLSPLTWPVYNLLETVEQAKISEASFFLVLDSNIPRIGHSLALINEFIQSLGCTPTRVLNKFREEEPDHVRLRRPGDIVVPNHAAKSKALPEFIGKTCTFALSPDWRRKVVENDLYAVRSLVDIEECKALVEKKKEDQRILDEQPRAYSTESCSYEVVVGTGGGSDPFPGQSAKPGSSVAADIPIGENGGKLSLDITVGGRSVGGGFTTTERRTDSDCAERRSKHDEGVEAHNHRLHEKQLLVVAGRAAQDEKLVKCAVIPNWQQAQK